MNQPNILLIHCHDLGRFLRCYGNPTVRTPNLDRLADEGIRFANAFCTAPQCSPSRASLFTGRFPHTNGVMGLTHASFGWDLHPTERHLASLLGEVGYCSDLIGVHHESKRLPDHDIAARLGFDTVTTGGCAGEVADRTINTLAARSGEDEPFYLQVGLAEPHRTGDPSTDGRIGFLGTHIEADDSLGVRIPAYLEDDESTRAEMAELQGAVHHMDAAVGRVLNAVDDLGLCDSTIVLFTTDHGLALPRAKCTLYDPGLETALIVRAPGLGWSGGRVVDGLVSNVDLVPTLLKAAGAEDGSHLHGRSLITSLEGDVGTGRQEIFGEITFHTYYDPRRCIRTEHHKLIVNFAITPPYMNGASQSWRPWATPKLAKANQADHTVVELYDLDADPDELTNVAEDPAYAEVLADLRSRLGTWMRETDDPLLAGPVVAPTHLDATGFLA